MDDTRRTAHHADETPAPLAYFSPGLSLRGVTQISGQGPLDPKTGEILHPGDIAGQTRVTLGNVEKVLHDAGRGFADVVMIRVYLSDRRDFSAMNAVFEDVLRAALGDQVPPARTTVIVGLPLEGMLVEIDALAVC